MTDSADEPEGRPVDYAVFCEVDVGKSTHHACALDPSGHRLHDKALPNDETALRQVFTDLGVHGRVLVVVDQLASIGALAIAVARAMGVDVAYLPGLAMRRIADLNPGQSKTDARDAFLIANAARSMPHTLRRVSVDEETVTELRVLAGYDADLVESGARLSNQLRDSLLHVHPALERVLGPVWIDQECWICLPPPRPRRRCASWAPTGSPGCCGHGPRTWHARCRSRSPTHCTRRRWLPRGPGRSPGSSRASQHSCVTFGSNATPWPRSWSNAWRPTLLPQS
ncbi:hypothetical protein GCM10017691_04360 [Pseudonocardia petroleophila]